MRVGKLFKRKLINNHQVNDLQIDSRKVSNNDVFFAIKGEVYDGANFIESAINFGAKTIVCKQELQGVFLYSNINFIFVIDVRKTLAAAAKIFYSNISKDLILIGVTGTNGKTTVTTLVYKYFQYINKKASLIGTNGVYIKNSFYSSENTTPDILEIYRILRESKKVGVNIIIMEVSSHAIKMVRIYGLIFKIVLITNLSRDHLDFHLTMDDYKYTKASFIASASNQSLVILNKELQDFSLFYRIAQGQVITFGKKDADYMFLEPIFTINNTIFKLITPKGISEIKTSLLGCFNIYNILAFVSIVDGLSLFSKKTIEYLNSKINILGRLEVIKIDDKYFVVDFAHTPEGVEVVLEFLRGVVEHKLYVVIGCGGERDRGKRKVIGEICSRLADYVIITNDNPREEDPEQIILDILEGVKKENYLVIPNRKMAIEEAYRRSLKHDIIAVLGKGNEQYQIIGKQKIPYNDKTIIKGLI